MISENKIKYLTHKEFVEEYKKGNLEVFYDRRYFKIENLISSNYFNKLEKSAHLFWKYLGIILMIPLPILLLIYKSWILALGSFIWGWFINKANRKSLYQSIIDKMIEDEKFCVYALEHGVEIFDKEDNKILIR